MRSPENVAAEMEHAKKLFPKVQEFFFDDDTFTANLPRAREIAKRLKPLGLTWSCNSRANVNRETIAMMKDCGLRLFLVGYESGRSTDSRMSLKRACAWKWLGSLPRIAASLACVIHGTYLSWACLTKPRQQSRTLITYAKELDVSASKSHSPHHILEQSYTKWRVITAGLQTIALGIVNDEGIQEAALEYPDLARRRSTESVERFYRQYYLRPRLPSFASSKTMLEDRNVFVRRIREGYEFFSMMAKRRHHVAGA